MRSRVIYADTYGKRHQRRLFLLAVLIIALGALFVWWHQRNPRPDPQTYPVLGVRLDQTDGVQDFDSLRSSKVSFVYLKATEGSSYFDDNFNTNFNQAAGSRLSIGIYHGFSFETTPQAQAAQFTRQVGQNIGDLPIGIYLSYYTEKKPSTQWLTTQLQTFVTLVQQHYHRQVLLMGSPSILKAVQKSRPASTTLGCKRQEADNEQWFLAIYVWRPVAEWATRRLPCCRIYGGSGGLFKTVSADSQLTPNTGIVS